MPFDQWPKGQLSCFPHAYQGELVNPVFSFSDPEPILDIRKFASFTIVMGVMVEVFKFVVLVKKVNRDPVEMTTSYPISTLPEHIHSTILSYAKIT